MFMKTATPRNGSMIKKSIIKDVSNDSKNWFTIIDDRQIAPIGWHVPIHEEWITLTTFLGSIIGAGGKLKETGTTHWLSPNEGAANETGFTALPGGCRFDTHGAFGLIYERGYWWSATESSELKAWYRGMYNYSSDVGVGYSSGKESGYSIRCVKD